MQVGHESQLHHDLARLFGQGSVASDDRTLLDRFLSKRDHAAFEVLVARHGPMVQGVCRRLLASPDDADDAFQATFLVLVRKAGRLRDADRLGPWLYGVASRVATKARARKARRRERNPVLEADFATQAKPPTDLFDVKPILDAELGQISVKLRAVLVLCLLEGVTAEEASHQLGCPLGTVKSRLARGREALRTRLVARGVAPAVALTASTSLFVSPVSASLTRATLGLIAATSASVAPGIAILTRGVAPAMISKSTAVASILLGGMILAGGGIATWQKAPALAQQPGTLDPRPADKPLAIDADTRRVSKNHMKQILLAFHNYHSAYDRFPPASISRDDGQPNLSWRVALLPYLGEDGLFKEFRLDEPWDSLHNKTLIPRMPAVYQTPDSPTPEGQPPLRGRSGTGATFEGGQGGGVEPVTDGTSNTALIASAREPIVWTRPGELRFQWDGPIPLLDESNPAASLVAMADGAILDYSPKNELLLRCMITRNGGEVINPQTQTVTPVPRLQAEAHPMMMGGSKQLAPPVPETPSRSEPPSSQAIEQRLQRLEEKFDRLLLKLDELTSDKIQKLDTPSSDKKP